MQEGDFEQAIALTRRLAAMDWDFVMQKLAAVLMWILVFAACYNLTAGRKTIVRKNSLLLLLLVPCAFLGLYRVLDASGDKLPAALSLKQGSVETILGRHAGLDPSFKLMREILTRPQTNSPKRNLRRSVVYLQLDGTDFLSSGIAPGRFQLWSCLWHPAAEREDSLHRRRGEFY